MVVLAGAGSDAQSGSRGVSARAVAAARAEDSSEVFHARIAEAGRGECDANDNRGGRS
jgi:hypothetical protein